MVMTDAGHDPRAAVGARCCRRGVAEFTVPGTWQQHAAAEGVLGPKKTPGRGRRGLVPDVIEAAGFPRRPGSRRPGHVLRRPRVTAGATAPRAAVGGPGSRHIPTEFPAIPSGPVPGHSVGSRRPGSRRRRRARGRPGGLAQGARELVDELAQGPGELVDELACQNSESPELSMLSESTELPSLARPRGPCAGPPSDAPPSLFPSLSHLLSLPPPPLAQGPPETPLLIPLFLTI